MAQKFEVSFLYSAFEPSQLPGKSLPEIAFCGRSNVGKSSLLNTLLGERQLARVSSTPGRTQAINFFLVDKRCLFADLPGYGFAQVPQPVQKSWRRLIESYLDGRDSLAGVMLLVDCRHPPHEVDLTLKHYLEEVGIPYLLVATKVDKLTPQQWAKALQTLCDGFGVDEQDVIPFSAVDGTGAAALWSQLLNAISEKETWLKAEKRWGLISTIAPAPADKVRKVAPAPEKKAAPPPHSPEKRVTRPAMGADPSGGEAPPSEKRLPAWLRYAPGSPAKVPGGKAKETPDKSRGSEYRGKGGGEKARGNGEKHIPPKGPPRRRKGGG